MIRKKPVRVYAVTVFCNGNFSAQWSKVFRAPKTKVDKYVNYLNQLDGFEARADVHILRGPNDDHLTVGPGRNP